MKNNRNPVRRNRNIGTAKSGQSNNNALVIPERWADYKIFWERLDNPVINEIKFGDHIITLLVEPTREGYVHACTPQDVTKVLSLLPTKHLAEIELVVFRQPNKKEEILNPAWGRFVYYADLGRYKGPGIYLEALEKDAVVKWGRSITPFRQKELDLLQSDGHIIKKVKRGYEIHTSPQSVRNTQLFRTVPHEIGHAVDYLVNCLNPSINAPTDEESKYISDVFDAKTSIDKEEYANRYAREFYELHSSTGVLPFDQIFDDSKMLDMGLALSWFR